MIGRSRLRFFSLEEFNTQNAFSSSSSSVISRGHARGRVFARDRVRGPDRSVSIAIECAIDTDIDIDRDGLDAMGWMRCVTRPRASHVVTRTRRTMDACERAERGDYAWFTALDDDGLRRACAARDDDGRSALHRACAAGTRGREVVRALVTSAYGGAKLAACADEGEWTCLHTAASMGESETCGLLLAVHAEGANARTPGGQTPGHYAASKGHVDVLRKLASAGGDLGASDNVGSTLLHRAAAQGRVGVIDYLVDQPGVALEARDGRGQTPLLTACEAGQDEAAIRLAKHGANIDARDEDKNGINELASKLVSILRQIKNEM